VGALSSIMLGESLCVGGKQNSSMVDGGLVKVVTYTDNLSVVLKKYDK
jgi:hypothetical protein